MQLGSLALPSTYKKFPTFISYEMCESVIFWWLRGIFDYHFFFL